MPAAAGSSCAGQPRPRHAAGAVAGRGAIVEQIVVYTSSDVQAADPAVVAALAAGRVDWITVTSSSIARSIAALFGQQLRRTRLASISPVTSQTLRELGHPPTVEAREYTMAGLVDAIADATKQLDAGHAL